MEASHHDDGALVIVASNYPAPGPKVGPDTLHTATLAVRLTQVGQGAAVIVVALRAEGVGNTGRRTTDRV